ncbi:MAG: hypothetical protein NTZ42_03760 [Candidatus Gribaldobacteria bacterium]|nr:hypothetical protein [Candidatus Gribaldobacteria bacterium]
MKGNIFTAVLGMSSGLTVQRWNEKEVETVCQMTIPWIGNDKDIFWPEQWLRSVVELVNSYAEQGDTIAWAMPGADLAFVERYRVSMSERAYRLILPILSYQSLADGVIFEEINKMVNPKKAYRQMAGANWAFFQPPSHIFYYLKELQSGDFKVISLADWISYLAKGAKTEIPVHDSTMLQSMGAYDFDGSTSGLYTELFGEDTAEKIFPFDVLGENAYSTIDDIKIIPCSHDSVFARRIGFSVCPSGIWTGTWVGTSDWIGEKNIKPSNKTFDAGIAFEGLGNLRALITNISMAGAIYKAIVQKLGWSYEQASKKAAEAVSHLGSQVVFDLDELPTDTEAVEKLVAGKALNAGDYTLAYLLQSLAAACRRKKEAVYKILRRKVPEEVAVFGGFAENQAFLQALKNFGFEPIVPKFASNATHAGLAMDALIRTGQAANDQEALSMLR